MSLLVVDASVAVKWVVEEEDSEAAVALFDRELVAPALMLPECANALWVKARRGELTAAEVIERIQLLSAAPVELVPMGPLVEDAAKFALELDHPVYDCCYLALASQRNTVVVTADRRFTDVVRNHQTYAGLIRRLSEPLTEISWPGGGTE
jgi:predicted nucleic acid-binding protein